MGRGGRIDESGELFLPASICLELSPPPHNSPAGMSKAANEGARTAARPGGGSRRASRRTLGFEGLGNSLDKHKGRAGVHVTVEKDVGRVELGDCIVVGRETGASL